MYSDRLNYRASHKICLLWRQHTHIHQPSRSTPLAAANARATAILRGHLLVDVTTVDDPAIARELWRAGIQGVVTNDPAVMIRARAELPALTR